MCVIIKVLYFTKFDSTNNVYSMTGAWELIWIARQLQLSLSYKVVRPSSRNGRVGQRRAWQGGALKQQQQLHHVAGNRGTTATSLRAWSAGVLAERREVCEWLYCE